MTWAEAKLELQLDAEERVGGPMREFARRERAEEDAAAGAVAAAVRPRR